MIAKDVAARASWFSAFGEPTRLGIVLALATEAKTVIQLAASLNVEMFNVSHHLKIMKDAGLVMSEKNGRFMIYTLVGGVVKGGVLELTHPSGAKVSLPLH